MKRALVIVDMQNDFLPGGALGVGGGDAVVPEIERLMRSGEYDLLVLTADRHPRDTKHFEKWPVHCVEGTEGAQICRPIFQLALKDRVPGVFIEKGRSMADDGYSGFEGEDVFGAPLDKVLRGAEIDAIDVVGLATDYCVKATAIDGARKGYRTTVLLGATRPVDARTGNEAVAAMVKAGVGMVRPCFNCGGVGFRCCEFGADKLTRVASADLMVY